MLEIKNVYKTINGKEILHNISFIIKTGQIYGFLGPNGSGKTSTIRIILGLYSPDSGFINSSFSQKEIGFKLDNHGLYSELSLIENIKLYSEIYETDFCKIQLNVDKLLNEFDLYDVKNVKVALFSTGMKQKLSFIRSIFHNPKLLILDEPFNGLDPIMQSKMRSHILYLSKTQNTTIFFSSHNLYEIERLCDKISIIKNGKIQYTKNLKLNSDKAINLENIYLTMAK